MADNPAVDAYLQFLHQQAMQQQTVAAANTSSAPASGVVGIPTDQTGAAWGGDPLATSVSGNVSIATAEQQAESYYAAHPEFQAYIQQNMGDVAWMLQNPELAGVIEAAAANQWTQAQIATALGQTNWWKTNGTAVRQFQQLQGSDPASAQQQVNAAKAQIIGIAQSLGVNNLSDSQLSGFATQAAEFQWNSAQMQQAVQGAFSEPDSGPLNTGTAADMQQVIKTAAGQYLTTASNDMIDWWTTQAIHQGQTAQQLQSSLDNYLGQQAAQRFPWMSTAISQGMTPQQFLDPYTQQAAKTLAISPDSIDWSDPKWQGALLQTGTNGQQAPVNADQFNKNLMQNPVFGYTKTAGAINSAYALSAQLEQTMGAIKT